MWDNRAIFYIINRKAHEYLEIWNLFHVLNRISDSFALLTHEISWSTLEINFIFPHNHYSLCIAHKTEYHTLIFLQILPTLTGNPGGNFIETNSFNLSKCLNGAMTSRTFSNLKHKNKTTWEIPTGTVSTVKKDRN